MHTQNGKHGVFRVLKIRIKLLELRNEQAFIANYMSILLFLSKFVSVIIYLSLNWRHAGA
jgi:hypothetical protein